MNNIFTNRIKLAELYESGLNRLSQGTLKVVVNKNHYIESLKALELFVYYNPQFNIEYHQLNTLTQKHLLLPVPRVSDFASKISLRIPTAKYILFQDSDIQKEQIKDDFYLELVTLHPNIPRY